MNQDMGRLGKNKGRSTSIRRHRAGLTLSALVALSLLGQGPVVQAQATASAQAPAASAVFKDEELDQMLAPIALYPDSLLAQVLMASTYPVDFNDAVAWSKAHPDEKGDAAIAKVESMAWDPSVKSLVAFPQVLAMMGTKPEAVQRLGDAFLADPARVMDRVQFLRKKAQEAGNLKTNEQQKVSTQTEASKQVIVIEPAQPQTVYVPAYQPTVYGSWWYPSYPPYYYPPPPYYYPPGGAFVAGVFWGAAIVGISNGLWGGCNWGRGDVNINVNRYNNVNVNNKINNGDFKHNPERRGDVPYRDNKSQQQFGQKQRDGAKDREAYRGKDGRESERANASKALADRGADPAAGREKLQGSDRERAEAATRDAGRGNAGSDRAGTADRAGSDRAGADRAGADRSATDRSAADRSGADRSAADRSAVDRGGAGDRASADRGGMAGGGGPSASTGALSGVQNSGAARADASRGQSSRSSMGSSGGGASMHSAPAARPSAGGGRAGGGGGRAGGGGRR